jgi:hypothetical protein
MLSARVMRGWSMGHSPRLSSIGPREWRSMATRSTSVTPKIMRFAVPTSSNESSRLL